jgi:hypothetical protein
MSAILPPDTFILKIERMYIRLFDEVGDVPGAFDRAARLAHISPPEGSAGRCGLSLVVWTQKSGGLFDDFKPLLLD